MLNTHSKVAQQRTIKRNLLIVAFIVLNSVFASTLNAAASLAAEDKIDEIPVMVNGVEESFTVLRDAQNKKQWYYIHDRPRLFERTIDGKTEPDFALIRYQFKDPQNPQQMLEGGLLQFAVSLAIPPEAINQLISAIQKKVGNVKGIRLAGMPLNEANVSIYTPGSGQLVSAAPSGEGIAPVHATQKMVFSIPMTRVGSDVYNELINGNTGIPVVIDYTYNGLTPAAGFSVTIDWDQTYKHYSSDKGFAAKASYLGLFGGSTKINRQKIMNTLIEKKSLIVNITEGEGFKLEDANTFLEPILKRINDEMMEKFQPPTKVTPAKGGTGSKGKYFSTSYHSSIKSVSEVKKGTETIDFNVRQHQIRKSVVSGFVGIGRYDDELKKRLVTVVPEGPWQSAYFVLPAVGDASELGINQVDLEIGLTDGKQVRQSQVVVWRPETGWQDRNGKPRTVLSFAIMGLKASGFDTDNAQFKTKAQITLKREVLKIEQQMPVFDGETAITTPLAAVDVVVVDGSLLNWNKVDSSASLAAVNVKLKSGSRVFSTRLKPRRIDGEWIEPQPISWLIPKGNTPVTANIKYLHRDGRKEDWIDNDKDLLEELSSLEITLFEQSQE